MPSTQRTPILKLDRDILWDIFGRSDSLDTIRHSSQVCQRWREILLDSPSLWAGSVDLDALRQTSNFWRNLVLERTGEAMLCVMGRMSVFSDSPVLAFLASLLDEQWTRIRDLNIIMTLPALDHKRIWQAFGRPAPNLQTFSCALHPFRRHVEVLFLHNLPLDFQMFSNHAPSLVRLHLFPQFQFDLDIKAPEVFTGNLRELLLSKPLVMTDVDLLHAFMQMPLIEEICLTFAQFVRTAPSEVNTIRPPVPRLKSVLLGQTDPGIFPAFLDCIIPSAGCALYVDHQLDTWSRVSTDKSKVDDIAHMHRVIERYANSYFGHITVELAEVSLIIDPHRFEFYTLTPHVPFNRFQINAGYKGPELHIVPDTLSALLDSLSTFKFPKSTTTLELIFGADVSFLTHAPSLKAFNSMNYITVLKTNRVGLLNLGRLPHHETLFPCLEVISMRLLPAPQYISVEESILPFLSRRHPTAPIKVLDLSSSTWPVGDLRFLDTLSGLKVVCQWRRSGLQSLVEYVCGSGDQQQLLLFDDQLTATQ